MSINFSFENGFTTVNNGKEVTENKIVKDWKWVHGEAVVVSTTEYRYGTRYGTKEVEVITTTESEVVTTTFDANYRVVSRTKRAVTKTAGRKQKQIKAQLKSAEYVFTEYDFEYDFETYTYGKSVMDAYRYTEE